jgi:transposase-like protein
VNTSNKIKCPICNHLEWSVKNGKFKDGRQSYYCKKCQRSFLESIKKTRNTKRNIRNIKAFDRLKKIVSKEKQYTPNYTELSKEFNVTRKTMYDWIERLKKEGFDIVNKERKEKRDVSINTEQSVKDYFENKLKNILLTE